MKIKIIIGALFALLIATTFSTDATANPRRRRWNSDDRKVYVPRPDESHVVYDGDRVMYDRSEHDSRRGWYRHYEDKDSRQYKRHERDRYDDKYYKRNHTKYHYRRDDSRE